MVLDGLAVFEFGVICEVFGIDRSADGVPNFDFKVCGPEPGKPLRTSVGATITPDHGLDDLVGADLVAIPAIGGPSTCPKRSRRCGPQPTSGSIILTVCSGAFVAGAAGLLDGRPCTTHWMHADELARHVSDRRGRPQRAVRRRRQPDHQRGHRGGHRRVPAPGPPRTGQRGHQQDRPPDGGAAAA